MFGFKAKYAFILYCCYNYQNIFLVLLKCSSPHAFFLWRLGGACGFGFWNSPNLPITQFSLLLNAGSWGKFIPLESSAKALLRLYQLNLQMEDCSWYLTMQCPAYSIQAPWENHFDQFPEMPVFNLRRILAIVEHATSSETIEESITMWS